LFLSSAVEKSPDHTMENIYRVLELLRYKYNFWGYVHVKIIPGASSLLVKKTGVLEAIILIENQQKGKTSGFSRGEQIMDQLKEVIAKGNATKLTIKKDNEVIINIPITAGLVSALVAPFLSAAGITVALLAKCSVEITQTDGKVIDLGKKVDEGMDQVKDAVKDIRAGAENIAENIKDDIKNIKSNS
jgi:hypothetical protein